MLYKKKYNKAYRLSLYEPYWCRAGVRLIVRFIEFRGIMRHSVDKL